MKSLITIISLLISVISLADVTSQRAQYNIPSYNFNKVLVNSNCREYLDDGADTRITLVEGTIILEMNRLEYQDIIAGTQDVDFIQLLRHACRKDKESTLSNALAEIADVYLSPIFFTEAYKKE